MKRRRLQVSKFSDLSTNIARCIREVGSSCVEHDRASVIDCIERYYDVVLKTADYESVINSSLDRAVRKGLLIKTQNGNSYALSGQVSVVLPRSSHSNLRVVQNRNLFNDICSDDMNKICSVDHLTEVCALCKGTVARNPDGVREELLTCQSCSNSGHPSCLNYTPELATRLLGEEVWHCADCKKCDVCKIKEGELFYRCDGCDKGFHRECISDPQKKIADMWLCNECKALRAQQRNKKLVKTAAANVKRRYQKSRKKQEDKKNVQTSSRYLDYTPSQAAVDATLKSQGLLDSLTRYFTPSGSRRSRVAQDASRLIKSNASMMAMPIDHHHLCPSSSTSASSSRTASPRRGKVSTTIRTQLRSRNNSSATLADLLKSTAVTVVEQQSTKDIQKDLDVLSSAGLASSPISINAFHEISKHDHGFVDSADLHLNDSETERKRKPIKKRKNKMPKISDKITAFDNKRSRKGSVESLVSEMVVANGHYLLPSGSTDVAALNQESPSISVVAFSSEKASTPKSVDLKDDDECPIVTEDCRNLFRKVQQTVKKDVELPMSDPTAPCPSTIQFGKYEIKTWYSAPYPQEYVTLAKLYICEFCLKYIKSSDMLKRHFQKCRFRHPPGNEIYRKNGLSVFEVDGFNSKLYCQNLCLLAKLFLDHKTLFYDVEPFLFYVLTINDELGSHLIGYFSKEKYSPMKHNVSCIVTLPPYQNCGYGRFLIDFSYLLSRKENQPGTPEKPLSDLGKISYYSYWLSTTIEALHSMKQSHKITVKSIIRKTGMTAVDIIDSLNRMGFLMYKDGHLKIIVDWALVISVFERTKSNKNRIWLDEECLSWQPIIHSPLRLLSNFNEQMPTGESNRQSESVFIVRRRLLSSSSVDEQFVRQPIDKSTSCRKHQMTPKKKVPNQMSPTKATSNRKPINNRKSSTRLTSNSNAVESLDFYSKTRNFGRTPTTESSNQLSTDDDDDNDDEEEDDDDDEFNDQTKNSRRNNSGCRTNTKMRRKSVGSSSSSVSSDEAPVRRTTVNRRRRRRRQYNRRRESSGKFLSKNTIEKKMQNGRKTSSGNDSKYKKSSPNSNKDIIFSGANLDKDASSSTTTTTNANAVVVVVKERQNLDAIPTPPSALPCSPTKSSHHSPLTIKNNDNNAVEIQLEPEDTDEDADDEDDACQTLLLIGNHAKIDNKLLSPVQKSLPVYLGDDFSVGIKHGVVENESPIEIEKPQESSDVVKRDSDVDTDTEIEQLIKSADRPTVFVVDRPPALSPQMVNGFDDNVQTLCVDDDEPFPQLDLMSEPPPPPPPLPAASSSSSVQPQTSTKSICSDSISENVSTLLEKNDDPRPSDVGASSSSSTSSSSFAHLLSAIPGDLTLTNKITQQDNSLVNLGGQVNSKELFQGLLPTRTTSITDKMINVSATKFIGASSSSSTVCSNVALNSKIELFSAPYSMASASSVGRSTNKNHQASTSTSSSSTSASQQHKTVTKTSTHKTNKSQRNDSGGHGSSKTTQKSIITTNVKRARAESHSSSASSSQHAAKHHKAANNQTNMASRSQTHVTNQSFSAFPTAAVSSAIGQAMGITTFSPAYEPVASSMTPMYIPLPQSLPSCMESHGTLNNQQRRSVDLQPQQSSVAVPPSPAYHATAPFLQNTSAANYLTTPSQQQSSMMVQPHIATPQSSYFNGNPLSTMASIDFTTASHHMTSIPSATASCQQQAQQSSQQQRSHQIIQSQHPQSQQTHGRNSSHHQHRTNSGASVSSSQSQSSSKLTIQPQHSQQQQQPNLNECYYQQQQSASQPQPPPPPSQQQQQQQQIQSARSEKTISQRSQSQHNHQTLYGNVGRHSTTLSYDDCSVGGMASPQRHLAAAATMFTNYGFGAGAVSGSQYHQMQQMAACNNAQQYYGAAAYKFTDPSYAAYMQSYNPYFAAAAAAAPFLGPSPATHGMMGHHQSAAAYGHPTPNGYSTTMAVASQPHGRNDELSIAARAAAAVAYNHPSYYGNYFAAPPPSTSMMHLRK